MEIKLRFLLCLTVLLTCEATSIDKIADVQGNVLYRETSARHRKLMAEGRELASRYLDEFKVNRIDHGDGYMVTTNAATGKYITWRFEPFPESQLRFIEESDVNPLTLKLPTNTIIRPKIKSQTAPVRYLNFKANRVSSYDSIDGRKGVNSNGDRHASVLYQEDRVLVFDGNSFGEYDLDGSQKACEVGCGFLITTGGVYCITANCTTNRVLRYPYIW